LIRAIIKIAGVLQKILTKIIDKICAIDSVDLVDSVMSVDCNLVAAYDFVKKQILTDRWGCIACRTLHGRAGTNHYSGYK
jgi:hypothetical protein